MTGSVTKWRTLFQFYSILEKKIITKWNLKIRKLYGERMDLGNWELQKNIISLKIAVKDFARQLKTT